MSQIVVFGTLVVMLALFISGRWRYDLVALLALLFLVILGIIPAGEAFLGFGHPAVITVAAILVVSRGLQQAGLASAIARRLTHIENPRWQSAALTASLALLSAFINNIGALALLMPVGIQIGRKRGRAPSSLLMPLAFASILGGLLTMIGTPLNIIIATFRADVTGEPFGVFAFTRVGFFVAAAGVAFLILFGWRFLPQRKATGSDKQLFRIENYIAEMTVAGGSKLIGSPVRTVGELTDGSAQVVSLERNGAHTAAPSSYETLQAGDILVVEARAADLGVLLNSGGMLLRGRDGQEEALTSDEVSTVEAVVMPDSPILNQTVRDIDLRQRFGINMLAVARRGQQLRQRPGRIRLAAGDVLLLQGRASTIHYALPDLGCLPLAERNVQLEPRPQKLWLGSLLFAAALVLAAVELLPIQIAFASAAVLMVLFNVLSVSDAYESIEWHILILLGAMIPIGHSLETSGGADTIAAQLLMLSHLVPPFAMVVIVLLVTMLLANTMNNKAAAIIIAPIAINIAQGLGASVDPFLMAVALGAEFVFLNPIGHQSNILVMGVGGYEFRDYWRLGLRLTLIVLLVAVPLLFIFWPLGL